MANAEKLWESFDDILAHRELWDQGHYIAGRVNRNAAHWAECGTTQCIAGFRCLRDGVRLEIDSCGTVEGFIDEYGEYLCPADHAARVFGLEYCERVVLFGNMTTDLGELKECIQEIIDGKYRDDESL